MEVAVEEALTTGGAGVAPPSASGAGRRPRLFAESGPAWLRGGGTLPQRGDADGLLREADNVRKALGGAEPRQEEAVSGSVPEVDNVGLLQVADAGDLCRAVGLVAPQAEGAADPPREIGAVLPQTDGAAGLPLGAVAVLLRLFGTADLLRGNNADLLQLVDDNDL